MDKLVQRATKAFDTRREWESLWNIAMKFMAPERATMFTQPRPVNSVQQEVFDSTAIDAAEGLADIMMMGIAPEDQRWLRFKPSMEIEDEDELKEVIEECQRVEGLLFERLSETQFYSEFPSLILDRIITGTGAMCYKKANDKGYFTALSLKNVAAEEDHLGRVSMVAVRGDWCLEDLERVYGRDKVPQEVKETVKDKYAKSLTVYDISTLEADGQWTTTVRLKDHDVELHSSTSETPYQLVSRWTRVPGQAYGRGPGLRALSDVRALNKLKELILKNAAKAVTGVYTAADDGVLNPYTVTFQPGAVIPVAENNMQSPPLMELPNTARFDVGDFQMDKLMASIQRTFLADQFGDLTRTPRSALEVAERTRVVAQKLGGTLNRLFREVIIPVVKILLKELRDEGEIPSQFVLGKDGIKIEFLSRLAQAQNQESERDILEYASIVTEFGQVDPKAGLVLDVHKALRRIGRLKGIHEQDMRSDAEINEILEQAAEAAQQQEAQMGGGDVE